MSPCRDPPVLSSLAFLQWLYQWWLLRPRAQPLPFPPDLQLQLAPWEHFGPCSCLGPPAPLLLCLHSPSAPLAQGGSSACLAPVGSTSSQLCLPHTTGTTAPVKH